MLDTLILRFRNHGENTIQKHRDCINETGHVIWGWWKKDTEPDRRDEIGVVKEILNREKDGIDICLFDRSNSSYFKARLIKVFNDNGSSCSTPDLAATPAYYRENKLPLWLKLTSIEELEQNEFEKKFGGTPKGEHTFFPFDNDKLGFFDSGVKYPASIALPHDRIVQLSDIHFGSDFGFPLRAEPGKATLIDRIEYELNNSYNSDIGLFLISGDLTSRAESDALFGSALEFLKNLSERFSVPPERFVIIPGNHDISLKNFSEIDYQHEKLFKLFLNQFYGTDKEIAGIDFFTTTQNREIQILRMNSVKLRKKSESNFGYVDWSLYEGIMRDVEHTPNALRIATMHHHLVSMESETTIDPDYPYANLSTTVDAGSVINGLQKANFDIVLHGHQHIPGITKISRGQINDNSEIDNLDTGLIAISAGSAGVKSERLPDDFRDNSFNVIEINKKETIVSSNNYNAGRNAKPHFKCILEN